MLKHEKKILETLKIPPITASGKPLKKGQDNFFRAVLEFRKSPLVDPFNTHEVTFYVRGIDVAQAGALVHQAFNRWHRPDPHERYPELGLAMITTVLSVEEYAHQWAIARLEWSDKKKRVYASGSPWAPYIFVSYDPDNVPGQTIDSGILNNPLLN